MSEIINNSENIPPVVPLAPPTVRQELGHRHSGITWIKVLGIIVIVIAILGLLFNSIGLITCIFMGTFFNNSPVSGEIEKVEVVTQHWLAWTLSQIIMNLLLAVLLLIAGCALLNKKTWCVGLFRIWLILKMLLVIIGFFAGILMQRAIFAAMQEMNDSPGSGPGPGSEVPYFGYISNFIYLIWGLLLPAFLLFWFSRRKIRQEISE